MSVIDIKTKGIKNIEKELNTALSNNSNNNYLLELSDKIKKINKFNYHNLVINHTKLRYILYFINNKLTILDLDKVINFIESTTHKYLYQNISIQNKEWWNNLSEFWKEIFTKEIGFTEYWRDSIFYSLSDDYYHDIDDFIINEILNIKKLKINISINDNINNFEPLFKLEKLVSLHIEEKFDYNDYEIDYTNIGLLNIEELEINNIGLDGICLDIFKNMSNLKYLSIVWSNISSFKHISNLKNIEKLRLSLVNLNIDYKINHKKELTNSLASLKKLKEIEFTFSEKKYGHTSLDVFSDIGLEKVYISKRYYSKSDINKYKKNNPNCILIDIENNKKI